MSKRTSRRTVERALRVMGPRRPKMRDSRRALPRPRQALPFPGPSPRRRAFPLRSLAVLVPKLYSTLQGYTRQQLAADVGAGLVVGVVAIPLAIAFAIASGVTPARGLYTAIIA